MKKSPNQDPKAKKTVGVRLGRNIAGQNRKGMGNKGMYK